MQRYTTLKNRADFLRLNRGHKYISAYFILRYALASTPQSRVGYTVTTKCGNAVLRNRTKRRLRSLVREWDAPDVPMDAVIIARADVAVNASSAPMDALRQEMAKAFASAQRKLASPA